MILSGKEIEREVHNGNILINPFNPSQVNPNSYNLTLHNELLVYEDDILANHFIPPFRQHKCKSRTNKASSTCY